MLFAIRLPRTEVTLVCYKRKHCRLSVKRRRCSRSSAGCATKTLDCSQHPFLSGAAEVCGTCGVYGLYCALGVACIRSCLARLLVCGTCEGKLYMRTQKRDWDKTQPLNFLLLFFWCFFVCIRSSFRCICFGSRRFSLYVSFGSGSSSCFLIHNRLLY